MTDELFRHLEVVCRLQIDPIRWTEPTLPAEIQYTNKELQPVASRETQIVLVDRKTGCQCELLSSRFK